MICNPHEAPEEDQCRSCWLGGGGGAGGGGASVSGIVQSDYYITFARFALAEAGQNNYTNSAIECFKSPAISLCIFGFDDHNKNLVLYWRSNVPPPSSSGPPYTYLFMLIISLATYASYAIHVYTLIITKLIVGVWVWLL